jgi:dihydroorotate dehydrogenase electron transfer subunit
MIQTNAPVTSVEISGPFTRVALTAPAPCSGLTPGRFVLADLGDHLRAPLFPAWVDAENLDILVPPEHPAAALRPGASVNLIGPLGQGFQVPETTRQLLLVADAPHLPALLPLTRQDRAISLLLSAPIAAALYPISLLPLALEVHLVTADGSAGHHGSPLDLFPGLARWADCICVAAHPTVYPALAKIVREVRIEPGRHFAQALVAPPMICGVGACQGCAVEVGRDTKLACTDGPVFDLLELR